MVCFITLLTSRWQLGSHLKIAPWPSRDELEWDPQNNTETQTPFLRLPVLLSQIIKENLAERQPGCCLYWSLFTVCFLFMFCSQTLTKYSCRVDSLLRRTWSAPVTQEVLCVLLGCQTSLLFCPPLHLASLLKGSRDCSSNLSTKSLNLLPWVHFTAKFHVSMHFQIQITEGFYLHIFLTLFYHMFSLHVNKEAK